jgi:ABC-type uncharacterized transport system involved in gliding motility auxiliary subunit
MSNQASPTPSTKIRMSAWLIAIIGLLLLVVSPVIYFVNQTLAWEMQLGFGVGGALLLGAVLLRPDTVRTMLTGRSVKYGSNAVVMCLAFIGILACLNFIALKNNREYDLTESGLFTLSDQTIQVLGNLKQPVQIFGFFRVNDPSLNRARDFLERYSRHTPYLSYEFHDPNIEPGLAESLGLTDYGGLVFVSGDNRYEVTRIDEQGLTSGLIRVTRGQPRTVYFVTGHGEHSIDDSGPEGYGAVKEALENDNYGVSTLDLASLTGGIPADTTALIVAGANRELLDTEAGLVLDWMKQGGKLMILTDPLEPVPLQTLLESYSLSVGNDIVIEDEKHALVTLGPDGLVPQVVAPLIVEYPYHEITGDLNGFQSFYPYARSITITGPSTVGRQISPILTTSKKSWAETDLSTPEPNYTKGVDPQGPFHLGVTVEDYEAKARLVVFGNAGFVTNQNVSPQMANLDLFLNAVNWLTEEDELISIRPSRPANRRVFLTSMQLNLTLFTSLVFIPLAVFGTGLAIWWKRR